MRIRWRGLELPNRIRAISSTMTSSYGCFVAEPFERGFGATIGNSLRRIMLTSLEGSSITKVRVLGVQHEFMTIPGIVEDVSDICLNLKSVVVKNLSPGQRILKIDRNSKGAVTASDISCPDGVEILNKSCFIATMTEDIPFSVELTVDNGRGYVPASEYHQLHEESPGVMLMDAIFSPVVRVRYRIDDCRVGQRTNYDRLCLEVWTNGTITPDLAVIESAKILRKHLNPFVFLGECGGETSPDGGLRSMIDSTGYSPVDLELEEKFNQSLAELNLSVRATNCLESEGINTIRDLVSRTEDQLLQVRNFGETTLIEVRERLGVIGLRLGMKAGKPLLSS